MTWGAAGFIARGRRPPKGWCTECSAYWGFSLTLPATRVAVGQLDPTLVGLGRAVVAAGLALAVLGARGEALPPRRLWARIGIVAAGVVLGFPFFSALALHRLMSAHSAVIVGLLPAATAVIAVARAGERPLRGFWIACAWGSPPCSRSPHPKGRGRSRERMCSC